MKQQLALVLGQHWPGLIATRLSPQHILDSCNS